MKKIINPVFIDEFLIPLIGGADDEEMIELFGYYKTDDENDVKKLAIEVLLPEYNKQKDVLKLLAKDTLAYYLIFPNRINLESIINSLLLPIDTPKNCNLFFYWIWEVFFPQESINYLLNMEIVEEFNISAPLDLLKGN
jgi:hypothetical protein